MKNPYQGYYTASYHKGASLHINSQGDKIIRSKLKEIPFSPNIKVLDVACGISRLGKTFSNCVYGFDINQESAKFAKKNGVIFKLGNIEKKWDYPDRYFDIVIASHIIEHVVNPDFLILEAKRVLKKGGLLIICTPNIAAWFNRILLLFGIQPFFTEVSTVDKTLGLKFTRFFSASRNPLGHLRLFSSGALREILMLHGFKVIKSSGAEFVVFPRLLFLIDMLFARFTSLASTIVMVGKK